jgi:TolB protein
MSGRRCVLLFIILGFALWAGRKTGVAEARAYLDVYGQSYSKITIAAPPFQSGGTQRPEMSGLLGQDLDMSGFFVVTPAALIDKEFLNEGVDRESIRFDRWRSLGIDVLCKATVAESAGAVSLSTYLYDAVDGSLLFAKKFEGPSSDWRMLVHRLADEIILETTGEKGIMSSRIIFVGEKRDVYVADLDGHEARNLTAHNRLIASPAISPDGRYLAFTSYKEGKPCLYVVDLETRGEVYVDRQDGMKIGEIWMDERTLAYSYTSGKFSTIYSVNVETKERKILLRKEGILTSPTFSPDRGTMVFVSDMYGGPNIFASNLSTGEIKRLSYFGDYNVSPAFSPKGDLIAFVSKIESAFEICVMNPDGSDARILTDGGVNDSPHFSSSGMYILYSSQKGNDRTHVYFMLRTGGNKRALALPGTEQTQPSFMPGE